MDPIRYALGRIWDTAIGLSVGMAINMLVFPTNKQPEDPGDRGGP